MTASSISTYLDVTRATEGATPGPPASTEPDSATVQQAGKILAAVHSGVDLITDIPEKTGLDQSRVFALLTAMSETNLVRLEPDTDGRLRVRLTDETLKALG